MLATCLALLPLCPCGPLSTSLHVGHLAASPVFPLEAVERFPKEGIPVDGDESTDGQGAASDLVVPAEALLIRAERLIVKPGVELENASIVVQDGRIVAVGRDVEVFAEETRILQAPVVCAGFLDPWSALGLTGTSVTEQNTSPSTRAVDGLDLVDGRHLLEEALAAGVTSVRAQAGAKARNGGAGAVLRTASAAEESVVLDSACVQATAGITRSGRAVDLFERADEVDRVISTLDAGRVYREGWLKYERELATWEAAIAEKMVELEKDFKKAKKDRDKEVEEAEEEGKEHKEERYKEDKKPKAPRYNADDEVMARVVHGELPLVVEVHRATEIRRLLASTEKFGRLRLVIAGGTQAGLFADELAARRIPVIVWPAPLGTALSSEMTGHDLSLAGELQDAGVEVLLGTGGQSAAATRDLPLLASLAVGYGLDREAAFHALTLGAARAFDVADRLGSVERGKDADLLLLDGDPLGATTRVLGVVSNGAVVVEP